MRDAWCESFDRRRWPGMLGDEATYSMDGVLTVKLGTALITVNVPMRPRAEEQAIAIGQKIVGRLRGRLRWRPAVVAAAERLIAKPRSQARR